MKWLTLKIEFLTGRYVAASVGDREKPEWPPHPGRVYMALAATCFERDENEDEVQALQWLESLKEPPIIDASDACGRSEVKFYVATNDKLTATKSILQATPGLMRSKQERMYPTNIPYESCCFYHWQVDAKVEKHLVALNAIAKEVIRVGHSSSLVHASFSLNEHVDSVEKTFHRMQRWLPARRGGSRKVRVAGEGEFLRLKGACRMGLIDQFAELKQIIESTKGQEQKVAKQKFEEVFGVPYKNGIRPPEPSPATISLWQGYEQPEAIFDMNRTVIKGAMFDSELLVLIEDRNSDQRNYTLSDTLAITRRLRDAVMSGCKKSPPPAWISGHDEKTREPTKDPHVAFIPLSFVDHKYADGSIKGLAIAFPKTDIVSLHERGEMLGPIFYEMNGAPRKIELRLGASGSWSGHISEGGTLAKSLQQETWIKPSHKWASVTPVVLDRFPKNSRMGDRKGWEQEVREIVLESCLRAGYPAPIAIDLDTTSWLMGSPRAYPKSRPLRTGNSHTELADLGDGFPGFPSRSGKPPRLQIHVHLTFDCAVMGPVLVGAGRFLGYGFFRPISRQ
jgi:CRISPR-associated protein Csb2